MKTSQKLKNKNNKLMLDISLCLIAKALLLTLLWWVCFSHPMTEQASLQKIYFTSHR